MLTRDDVPILDDERAALYVGHTLEWAKAFLHFRAEVDTTLPPDQDELAWDWRLRFQDDLDEDENGRAAGVQLTRGVAGVVAGLLATLDPE